MSTWIACDDRLPDDFTHVLVYSKSGLIYVARKGKYPDSWTIRCDCYDRENVYDVTHWMNLPDFPSDNILK